MAIEKIDSVPKDPIRSQSITKNIIKKGEFIVARVVKKNGPHNIVVNIKGKNYTAFVKENIDNDIFLAKAVKVSPKLILKFIKNLGSDKIRFNLSSHFFKLKKEFIQKLITSDNFVIDGFLNIENPESLESGKEIISLFKKYLSNWYTPILKELFSKHARLNDFQKLYHRFLVFQSLHNVFNLEHLSFLIPIVIDDKKYLLNMMVLNKQNDLSYGVFIRIYLNRNSEVLFLIYLDQKLVNCSLSSNDSQLIESFKENINILSGRLSEKVLGRKVEINIVPFSYLSRIDDEDFKTIDIRM